MSTQIAEAPVAPFSKFRELTADVRVAMLTTRSDDGLLHSRPMGTRPIEEDGSLWFFTAEDSGKVHEIFHDQQVNVAYAHLGGQIFVSVSGRAWLQRDHKRIQELWTPVLKAWFSDADDPRLALLRVDIEAIDYWEGPGKVISLLKFASSAVTGKRSKLGEHGKIVPPKI